MDNELGTKRPVRIVMVGDFPRDADHVGGGVESVMLYLCEHLGRDQSLDLHVVTLDRWGLGEREVNCGGFTAHYLEQAAIRGPLKRILNIRRLRNKIGRLQPALVHAQIAGQYSQAAHLSGRPYVLTLHGVRFLEAAIRTGFVDRVYRRHLVRTEERRGILNARHLISINPFIEKTFCKEMGNRFRHIENPIADTWFDVSEAGDTLGLLYAGRITPRKDILTLLRAFQRFHERFPDARLRIAGAPDSPDKSGYFDSLKAFIADAGLADAVEFLGNLSESELAAEYRRNAYFVISSVLETAPMSIAQAQAAGRVIVTTDAGGCRHMIEHRSTGMVVPIGDAEAFASALIECAGNGELRESMRQATRVVASKRYRASTIADRTLEFYKEILSP